MPFEVKFNQNIILTLSIFGLILELSWITGWSSAKMDFSKNNCLTSSYINIVLYCFLSTWDFCTLLQYQINHADPTGKFFIFIWQEVGKWAFLTKFKHRFSLADDRADLGRFFERLKFSQAKTLHQSDWYIFWFFMMYGTSEPLDHISATKTHEYFLINTSLEQF